MCPKPFSWAKNKRKLFSDGKSRGPLLARVALKTDLTFRPMVALVVVSRRTLKVSLSYIFIIATMTTEVKPQGTNNLHCFALLFKDKDK